MSVQLFFFLSIVTLIILSIRRGWSISKRIEYRDYLMRRRTYNKSWKSGALARIQAKVRDDVSAIGMLLAVLCAALVIGAILL